ncbi:hypothetical protein [Anaerobacillus arseniciselenatis]|nr:hypothetical protein [Anaerobacillus arseniciselenatis]
MYNVLEASNSEIFLVYIVIFGACILLSPIVSYFYSIFVKGTSRWR